MQSKKCYSLPTYILPTTRQFFRTLRHERPLFAVTLAKNASVWATHKYLLKNHWLQKNIHDYKMVFDKKVTLAEKISIRRQSKTILSLFGWGEICSRDFQAFIAGSCLIVSDTTHLKTWPTTHITHKTCLPIKWNLSNIKEVYEKLISNKTLRLALTIEKQTVYRQIWSHEHRKKFCQRISYIIRT